MKVREIIELVEKRHEISEIEYYYNKNAIFSDYGMPHDNFLDEDADYYEVLNEQGYIDRFGYIGIETDFEDWYGSHDAWMLVVYLSNPVEV